MQDTVPRPEQEDGKDHWSLGGVPEGAGVQQVKGTRYKPDLCRQHNTALPSVITQGSPPFPDSKICHFGPTISHSALADETQTKSMCACPGLTQGGYTASS
ncbi:hypothetical protein Nmel_017612 [Mimus melanotis]